MKRLAISACSIVTLLALAACESTEESRRDQRKSKYGYHGEEQSGTQTLAQPTPEPAKPDDTATPQSQPEPTPPPPPTSNGTGPAAQAPTKKDYPYGVKVPGKDGFVTSPYSPMSGYVDVRGFPPGTEVKDPYSGKIFLVP
jgi:hypothetical protein